MKLVIAGSRDFTVLVTALEMFLSIHGIDVPTEVVSGGCPTGADYTAKEYALSSFSNVKYTEFAAEWEKYGPRAGPIRNKKMAVYGDALLLIWDGKSAGSSSMKKEMIALNKPVYEIVIKSYVPEPKDDSQS